MNKYLKATKDNLNYEKQKLQPIDNTNKVNVIMRNK